MIAVSRAPMAYLATEIPGLSETFVYEELLALEARGERVIPISLRRPPVPAQGQEALGRRTHYLYERPRATLVAEGLLGLPRFGAGAARALRWLAADMRELGLSSAEAWKLPFQLLVAVGVAELLRANRVRHLHVHFAHVTAQIAMYASALSGVPFTVTGHANDLFERGRLLRRKAERAARFLTVSEHNRAWLERLGVPREKLAVVRCGVSFPPPERDAAHASRTPFRVGSLGRLVEKKGMDVLLRAAAGLARQGLALEVSLAGSGPMRPALEVLARELGIAGSVRFEGTMAHRDVAAWMRGLDCFALACRPDARGDMDGIPVVLMEAMSQSVPVVSTRLSGIPELVIHEQTGLLAEPGDAAGLADAIARLAASAELRARLASGARAHVEAEFGRETNLERLAAHFRPAAKEGA